MAKVLFVDDSISVRLVASRLLNAAQHDVTLAVNGEDAIEKLASCVPDIVVSDIIMPDQSGFDVCAHVRAGHTSEETPVLLISNLVDEHIQQQARDCGANGVIKKPFSWDSLISKIETLVTSRPAQQVTNEADDIIPFAMKSQIILDSQSQQRGIEIKPERLEPKQSEPKLENEKSAGQVNEEMQELRKVAIKATEKVRELERQLAESLDRGALLQKRLREIEHAAVWAHQLGKFLNELSQGYTEKRKP